MNGALTSWIFAFPDDVGSALTDLGGGYKRLWNPRHSTRDPMGLWNEPLLCGRPFGTAGSLTQRLVLGQDEGSVGTCTDGRLLIHSSIQHTFLNLVPPSCPTEPRTDATG